MIYLIEAFKYVTNDSYFWISMSITTCIGIFIGAVLYDGLLNEVKKLVFSILSYAFLILMTNVSRIMPIINSGSVHDTKQPFAGTVTILFVTIFYLFGLWLGVYTVNKAHSGKCDSKRKGDKSLFTK